VENINFYTRNNDTKKSKNRAIIVFFENKERLLHFKRSDYFSNVIEHTKVNILTPEVKFDDRKIMIDKAATCGQVTLSVKTFARGTDFASEDNELNKKGGVHVLQTFFSTMESEEVQTKGRAARQGEQGSYGMVLLLSDPEKKKTMKDGKEHFEEKDDTLASFKIKEEQILQVGIEGRYDELNKIRNDARIKEGEVIDKNLKKAEEKDAKSRAYFDALMTGDHANAYGRFEDLYEFIKQQMPSVEVSVGLHIVLMMDESGSMEGAPFEELRNAYNNFMTTRSVKGGDEDIVSVIMFSAYLPPDLAAIYGLPTTPGARTLSSMISPKNYPPLDYQGGGTAFTPALQYAEIELKKALHMNKVPILILMTDGECGDLDSSKNTLRSINNQFKDNKLQCHFVAFGSDANIDFLKQLQAECTTGKIHTAAMGELTEAFREIADNPLAEYI